MELPRVLLDPSICQEEVAAPNRKSFGIREDTSEAKDLK
jgi:hypothetical protein